MPGLASRASAARRRRCARWWRCKLDPSLKATCFQPLKPESAYGAFNLNLVLSELAPLQRGGGGARGAGEGGGGCGDEGAQRGDEGRDVQPALIGRRCVTERDSVLVQYNGIV